MMTPASIKTKQLAQHLVEGMLYIPKGLFMPIVHFLDDTREVLIHDCIGCAYCDKKLSLPKNFRNKFSNYANRCFDALDYALYILTLQLLISFQIILYKFLDSSRLEKINTYLLKKIEKPLDIVKRFLLENHYHVVWYGFGLLLLLASTTLWGWGIIPEVYVFCIASSWSGRILNHIANLLIRRKNSDEWQYLKNMTDFFLGKKSDFESKEIKELFKKLIIEFSLITILGRFSQFIGYCFQAFFSWLLFYLLVKSTAEQAPQMMFKGEQLMNRSPKTQGQYHFDNVLWVVSYKLFKNTSSPSAQRKYDLLHHQIHQMQSKPFNSKPSPDFLPITLSPS